MTATETVTSRRAANGVVAVITINDGKANALTVDVLSAVGAAIDEACADDTVGAIVLAGRDGRFSGGFDLAVMQSGDFPAIVNMVADGGELVAKAYGCTRPIVAACTGHAVAGGALLLLGCDVRVGAGGPYKIGLNEVAIGMVLPEWAMTIVDNRVSRRHVQRCVANARMLNPSEAVDAGFLDLVVEPPAVVERAIAEATVLATLDVNAYAKTVERFRGPVLDAMADQLAADRKAVL